jgi:anti-anti-sigma factor
MDLTDVRYLSSTGFAVLLGLSEKMKAAGGVLKICGLNPDVAVGANIIGLGRLVETYADASTAVESF